MPMRLSKFALVLVACALAIAVGTAQAARYRVVGYATDWNAAQARTLDRIDTLIFAFAHVERDRVVLDGDAPARLQRLLALKRIKPSLKVTIAVGGWGAGGFSEAAATAEGRQAFARSAAELMAAQGADGLDVDWEYPGHGESGIASSPQDRTHFTLMLKALREALDRQAGKGRHYTLSIAVADGPFVDGIDIAAVAPVVDWFNLMTYDFVNRMTPTTGHHAGLNRSLLAPATRRWASSSPPACRPGSCCLASLSTAASSPKRGAITRASTSPMGTTRASTPGRSSSRPTSAATVSCAIGMRRRWRPGCGTGAPMPSSPTTTRSRSPRKPRTSNRMGWAG